MKKALALAIGTILGTSAIATSAHAEGLSLNVGATSNYLWRGITQTGDSAAISGGIDYENSGFYVGTWASNVDFGDGSEYELDGYFGYAGEAGPVGFDVGYIYYAYPLSKEKGFGEYNFGELYGSVSWEWLTGGIAFVTNTQDGAEVMKKAFYPYVDVAFDVAEGLTFGAHVGYFKYDKDENGGVDLSYTDFNVSLTKSTDFGDIGVLASVAKGDELDKSTEDPRIAISYAISF